MIIFNFTLTTQYEQWHNDKSFSFLEYEGNFEITIDSKILFSQPYIIILEFLRDAFNWISSKDKSKDMLYNCIETDDNPLIRFIEKDGMWYIQSPWQKYECDVAFTREELETAVLNLDRSVNEQLKK